MAADPSPRAYGSMQWARHDSIVPVSTPSARVFPPSEISLVPLSRYKWRGFEYSEPSTMYRAKSETDGPTRIV